MKRFDKSGMSLLTILVSLTIGGIILAAAITSLNNSMKVNQQISKKSDIEDLRKYIRIGMSCENTLASLPLTCATIAGNERETTSPIAIALMRPHSASEPLVALAASGQTPTRVGNYELMAVCTGANEFRVRYRSFGEPSDPWKELLDPPLSCTLPP